MKIVERGLALGIVVLGWSRETDVWPAVTDEQTFLRSDDLNADAMVTDKGIGVLCSEAARYDDGRQNAVSQRPRRLQYPR